MAASRGGDTVDAIAGFGCRLLPTAVALEIMLVAEQYRAPP